MRKILLMLIISLTLVQANFSERNHYTNEIKFNRNNWTFGNTGNITTTWGETIAENAYFYIEEEGRIKYIINENGIAEIPKVKSKTFSMANATYYIKGIAQSFNEWVHYPIVETNINCALVSIPGFKNGLKNQIDGIHWRFPEMHVTEQENGWCLSEP